MDEPRRTWGFRMSVADVVILLLTVPATITAMLIWVETRLSRYHGVWADRLNPRLDEYLSRRK